MTKVMWGDYRPESPGAVVIPQEAERVGLARGRKKYVKMNTDTNALNKARTGANGKNIESQKEHHRRVTIDLLPRRRRVGTRELESMGSITERTPSGGQTNKRKEKKKKEKT